MTADTPVAPGAPTVERFRALAGPLVRVPKAMLLLGAEGEVDLALPCFLVEHERGRVLVDTGLDPAAAEDPAGVYGEELGALLSGGFSRDLAADRQLEKLGLSASDVDTVVMTHLHFDHTGGMGLFRHAQFVGGRGEIEHAFWPDPANLAAGYYRLEDFGFLRENQAQWWEVGPQDHDLFGDGSVVLFHLPGHTPGQLAVLVRAPDGAYLLGSDVVHLREGLEGVPYPLDWDVRENARSVGRLKALARAHDAELWVSHDPEDWARLGPGGAGDGR